MATIIAATPKYPATKDSAMVSWVSPRKYAPNDNAPPRNKINNTGIYNQAALERGASSYSGDGIIAPFSWAFWFALFIVFYAT